MTKTVFPPALNNATAIKMNIVFLDYDGVVNTLMWDERGDKCGYYYPDDNMVNNFQAVQWVSEFCEKAGYCIVVTSSWRLCDNYIDCLINGGLRDNVPVVGKTPYLKGSNRADEIRHYLQTHPEIENYIIFDDLDEMEELSSHQILCNSEVGFGVLEYKKAMKKHEQWVHDKKVE